MRVSLAGRGGVCGRRGVFPAPPLEPGFSPPIQGNLMVPVLIGCPPGKRLAFDITYTLEYNRLQNKHYFDCVHVDPEMPCFLFRDSACPAPSSQCSVSSAPNTLPSQAFPPCPLTAPAPSALPLGPLVSPSSPLHPPLPS